MIEVSGVTVTFGGLRALDDVSLAITTADGNGGMVFGLIGPNGAGKTTLLNALTGFVRTDSGTIEIDGTDVTRMPVQRRARLGVVRSFQTVRLLEDETLRTNLLVGAYRFNRGMAPREMLGLARSRAAAQAEAIARAGELLGLEERDLDRPVSSLPFGMRRMAELGRVLMAEPRVALLDEPAAGLTEEQRRQLAVAIRGICVERGVTVVMTEHDMDFVEELCAEVAVLDSGRLIAHGTPRHVLSQPAVQLAYFGEEQE